jgi:cyclopropane-fatty-acyl-phospholipid synthase
MSDVARCKQASLPAEISAHGTDALTLLLSRAGRRIRAGRLSVVTPDGARITFTGAAPGPSARIILHRWRALWSAALSGGVGLGRSYARGDWDSPDVAALIRFLACNIDHGADRSRLAEISRRLREVAHRLRANSPAGSRRNIAHHYDIDNAFYGAWLDSTWTYSSALFRHPGMTLVQAQEAKYRRIAEKLLPAREDHILEIGCGWGGFALFAARTYGVRVTAITLSEAQLELAQKRAYEAGLAERVTFHLRDYRELDGQYDHVVSIEMLEAVGEEYWPLYFETVARCLTPNGRAALQSIVIDPSLYRRYRRGADFIQSCVFPGGMLPTDPVIMAEARHSGLALRDKILFGAHYARTLNLWRANFADVWPMIAARGFDERFRRFWSFYLAYCEGAFLSGRIDVGQWIFESRASFRTAWRDVRS